MSTYETTIHHTIEDVEHELFSVVTEVNVPHLAFTLLSLFILVFGMFSALIKERIYLGEAAIATAFGIAFGPYGADLFNPRSWGDPSFDDITLEFTRIVLALSVFAVGVELPRAYVKRHWRSLVIILGPLMVFGWLVTGALVYALIPGLSFLGSLIIAACATPTDPILAASVVGKGKFAQQHVPSHIRHLLQCESGCNDGAAFPFLYLALFLNFRGTHNVGQAIGWWILLVIMYQILLGIVIGAGVGIIARKVLKFSKRRSLIDRESMVAMYISLAIFTTAATTLAGSDDLLAAFACGAAFAWDDFFTESIEDSNFSNIIDLLINCAVFIYIGATMPFSDFNNSTLTISAWRLVVIGLCVLVARRLPAMLLMYKWIPDIKTFREAVFAGHFGPMGVGAIFIATLALTKLPTPNIPPEGPDDYLALNIQPIVYFLVLCSIIVHGSSIPFFNLGKRVHSFHRTLTNRSDSEPSWLSRVKRAGDGDGIIINRDDNEKEKGKREKDNNVDLEAGERVIDDAGMDIGDMSSHDYAMKKASPANSEETVSGSYKGKERESPPSSDDNSDHRSEAHYREKDSNDQQVWQEGGDTVIDSKDGEDTRVVHGDGSEDEQDYTSDGANHHKTSQGAETSSSGGGGFPDLSSRMAQIEAMLEKGHHMSHSAHEKASADDVAQKAAGKKSRHDEDDSKRRLEDAAERIVREDSRAQRGTDDDHDGEEGDHVPPMQSERKEAPPQKEEGQASAPGPSRPTKLISRSMESFINRPKTGRKPTLTNEEKMARDAWCRRERRDCDDDEARAWVSGKHIVIERNNGEDVEVIDANPGKDAREHARKDPDLKLGAVDQDRLSKAKKDIAAEDSAAGEENSRGRVRSGSASQAKRFDLKSIRNNQSFRKFFGGTGDVHEDTSSPSPARSAEGASSPSRDPSPSRQGVTFSSNTSDKPQRPAEPAAARPAPSPTPNFLSTRGKGHTGVPLERSETTDSQVRFGHLPVGKRK